MEDTEYDVIIVGSGTSAHHCAMELTDAGKRIAMIEERPYGGTCALRGCQPKKYLVANAQAVASASHLVGQGIAAAPKTDWRGLQELKQQFLDGLSEEVVDGFQSAGIDTFHGHAQMVGPNTVEVGEKRINAKHIVLATGALPHRISIPGCELIGTSNDFLELKELPPRVIFIGGGYISCEFATVSAYAGGQATILQRSERILKQFDPDCVKKVVEAAEHCGIDILTNESPVKVEKTAGGLAVHTDAGNKHEADVVIEATGRIPNLSVLSSDSHNVEYSPKGITVNEYLQSVSNPSVYSIGDGAAAGYQLAPVGDREGVVAAENILYGNRKAMDYSIIPSIVFTIPNLSRVGMDETAANKAEKAFRVSAGSTKEWPSSKRIGEKYGYYKILIEKESEKILGATLVRHNAGEVINLFALAIRQGLTTKDLKEIMWAYPTSSSDLKNML